MWSSPWIPLWPHLLLLNLLLSLTQPHWISFCPPKVQSALWPQGFCIALAPDWYPLPPPNLLPHTNCCLNVTSSERSSLPISIPFSCFIFILALLTILHYILHYICLLSIATTIMAGPWNCIVSFVHCYSPSKDPINICWVNEIGTVNNLG